MLQVVCNLPNFDDGSWTKFPDVVLYNNPEKTEEDLQFVIDVSNARENTCDLSPICIAPHTDLALEEPPVEGWTRNFRLASFNGLPSIIGDIYLPNEKAYLMEAFPRRSVEITWSDGKIDPVMLLGGTTPAREIGIAGTTQVKELNSKKNQKDKDIYDMPNEDLVKEVCAALEQTDWMKYLRGKMDSDEKEANEEEEKDKEENEESAETKEAVKETEAPAKEEVKEKSEDEDEKEVNAKYSKALDVISKTQKEINSLKTDKEALEQKLVRNEREKQLSSLKLEGFVFDAEEELDDGANKDAKAWNRQLGKIKSRYSKLKPEYGLEVATPSIPKGELSKADLDKVINLVISNEIPDYSQALQAVKTGQR